MKESAFVMKSVRLRFAGIVPVRQGICGFVLYDLWYAETPAGGLPMNTHRNELSPETVLAEMKKHGVTHVVPAGQRDQPAYL
jgi:hypothetical protein